MLASATTAQAQTTALFFESQTGDPVGDGNSPTYLPPGAEFSVTGWNNTLSVSVRAPNYSFWWNVYLWREGRLPLTVGSYYTARRYSPEYVANGLDFSGSASTFGGSCSSGNGRFDIREIVIAPDGTVQRLAVDFEQHCDDKDPALFGAVRYNSTISDLTPFQGNYPRYELTITPSAHGRVTGAGIDCGSGATTCTTVLATPADLSLTATPDAGYLFGGWIGDCESSSGVTVRINSYKKCEATFAPEIASSRTLLLLDSDPGDRIGAGQRLVYSLSNSAWTVSSSKANSISLGISTQSSTWWIDLQSAEGTTLEPGIYSAVRRYSSARFNVLSVYNSARSSCSSVRGRFVILEFVRNTNGTVERFAADVEQHCDDADAGLFAAIRYNSTISETIPFQGDYPRYELTIAPSAYGRVTGPGVDCGVGGAACHLSFATPTSVSLTAAPQPGYLFLGWAGDCLTTATTISIRVHSPKACSALFEPRVSTSPRTFLFWDSQPGDYIGGGIDAFYSPANTIWSITTSQERNYVQVHVDDGLDQYWTLSFSAPEGQPLTVGTYSAARRYPFTPFNGLSASGSGRGCNTLTGRFVILEFVVDLAGAVERFAADFEQHCEDDNAALFGAVRYNSTITEIVPFNGVYPTYQLTITPPVHGRVTGQGLNCGGNTAQCQLTWASPSELTLTATPDFGYLFTGWTEDCSGGATTALHVNGPKRCAARFEPIAATGPRTLLRWDSEPNHYIGQGRSEVLSLVNSVWKTTETYGNGISVTIESVDAFSDSYWTLNFRPPTDEQLQVGRTYITPDGSPSAGVAGFEIYGNGRYCDGGEFTVRELQRGNENTVVRFAVDFVLICGSAKLTGSLQYNSIIDVPTTTMTVEPAALRFASLYTGSTIAVDPTPQALRLTISRADIGWTATANQSWITITPASGTGSTALTVALNLLNGHPGTGNATGAITITLTDGTGTSKTVNLTVTLYPMGTTTLPFGTIDTPLPDRTGVTGAIPITGWALDDFEVASVAICRAAAAGESAPADVKCGGNAQIYVGDAVFIEGARPDVQAAYSAYPRNDAAGWGFLLLTNTLPDQGNGLFTFHVYARDREGQVVLLGSRTMTCDNAHATLPFGTIDTPTQGETVSGASFVNFGWALTQNPKNIPIDGSTMMVYVDGAPVGNPSYNHFRPDIAAIFPGFANSNGAVGFKIIDTTALSNDLHTIVWTATDSAGATAGLGSRFFRVLNGATSSVTEMSVSAAMTTTVSSDAVMALPLEASPLVGRRSWSSDAPWGHYGVNRSGRVVLHGEELDRFELALGVGDGDTYSGSLRVGDRLRPLPAGSRLDAETGAFTWSPGVGFVGTYDVVFVRRRGDQPIARREVRFLLHPKGSGHIGAQAVIDTPGAQHSVVQPFAVKGWALDLDAVTGTGVDTVHVWAYPVTGGSPIFLGATTTGGARPDLAAVNGDQFRDAGFDLTVQGLTPGTYDLAVFPWSTVIGTFASPATVRVTVQ